MLLNGLSLRGIPVMSLHLGDEISRTGEPIIDPNSLRIVAFWLNGGQIGGEYGNILEMESVREIASLGMIIDSIDELVSYGDVIRLDKIIDINFSLIGKKVESSKGARLGKVVDYIIDPETFTIMQLIVKRPAMKSFFDSELTIGRSQIKETTDHKIIVKEELADAGSNKDFVPNFVNPFRKEPNFAPAHSQTPDAEDIE
jgi:sporulation protein YlmC with PRC-barrel domain